MRVFHRIALSVLMLASVASLKAAEAPATFKVSELSFARPEGWGWVPSQGMRKAQLSVPNTSGEAGEVIFFHFGPNNGGGTQANVERWYRQFQGSKEEIKARSEDAKGAAGKIVYVFAEGTYMSGMPGGPQTPKAGFALAGAIVEHPAGAVFVKFTGPKAVVEGGKAAFRKMVEAAK